MESIMTALVDAHESTTSRTEREAIESDLQALAGQYFSREAEVSSTHTDALSGHGGSLTSGDKGSKVSLKS
jgi:hypothetical protein